MSGGGSAGPNPLPGADCQSRVASAAAIAGAPPKHAEVLLQPAAS
jgi:hypothetical protein